MAIVLDERARQAVTHRRKQGRDPRILLYVDRLRRRAGMMAANREVLRVSWIPPRWPPCVLVARTFADVTAVMDTRMARYLQGHDLTISALHLGPIDQLTIDAKAIGPMQEWERLHPAGAQRAPASSFLARESA